MNSGSLVILEGLDGSGKSTQVERLAAALRAAGRRVLATREPTSDGPFGRRLRELARRGERLPPQEELACFVEDRRTHVAGVIRPALAAGTIVVSDRYFLSTVAYQGARGLDPARILAESEAEFPLPDLAILLEIGAAEGLRRARGRPGIAESFEEEAYLERVAAVFRSLDRPYLVRVDARPAPDTVHAAIRRVVGDRLALF